MITKKVPLREVYVWQLPVRIFHWVNAFCITVLIITGFIIGNPPTILRATAPEFNYWFGYIRLAHFIAAFVFLLNLTVRIYWAFVGNSFARWNNFIPTTRRQINGIRDTIKVDVLLLSKKPIYDIGHNSLAAFTYFILFLFSLVQIITGFAMFSAFTNNIFAPFFKDILLALDGFFPVRHIHHIMMWGFVLFAIVHIYLVFYHDYIERNGIASSIIGGWKFINEKIVQEYITEQKELQCIQLEKEQEKQLKKEVKNNEKNIDSRAG